MRTLRIYFTLEYKKSIKVLLKTFSSTLIMLLLVILGVSVVSRVVFHSRIFEPVKVAMVIPEEQEKVKMVTQLAATMKSVESICEFVYTQEKEAKKMLAEGELQAAIILPENFYEDINTGGNTPLTIYVAENASLNQRVFQELLADGVSLLRTSEAGVYSMLDASRVYPAELTEAEIGDVISKAYIAEAFHRGEIFGKSIYSPLGEMDVYEYYFASAVTIILLMAGMNFSFLYYKKSRAVEEKLRVSGVGAFSVSVVKIIVMGNFLWLLNAGVYIAGCMISKSRGSAFLVFEGSTLLYLVPQCLAIAAYFHLLYVISGKSVQGGSIVLAANIFMVLCSGAVIPVSYLPEAAGRIGEYLPLNFWNQYGADIFFEKISAEALLIQAVFITAAAGIGAIVSWKNT